MGNGVRRVQGHPQVTGLALNCSRPIPQASSQSASDSVADVLTIWQHTGICTSRRAFLSIRSMHGVSSETALA